MISTNKSGWAVRCHFLDIFGNPFGEPRFAGVFLFSSREARLPPQWRGLTIAVFKTRAEARRAAKEICSGYCRAVPVRVAIEITEAGPG